MQDNFRYLAIMIANLVLKVPTPFQDVRMANETEPQFQERAKNEFRTYQNGISTLLDTLQFTTARYDSFQRVLSHFPDIERQMADAYEQQLEVRNAFQCFEAGLQHLTTLSLTDLERREQAQSLHAEMMVNAKIALFNAASYFCQTIEDETDSLVLWDALRLATSDIEIDQDTSCRPQATKLAALYATEKADILAQRLTKTTSSAERAINRQITDPYLVMLRKNLGLPLTLTAAAVFALQNAELDTAEQDPAKLFELAAVSYLELDGHAARFYFQRAIETDQLSPLQRQFAELSIDRIANPDTYQDSNQWC